MTECQNRKCGAETQLFLCSTCESELGDMLTALTTGGTTTDSNGRTRQIPGLLQDLEDAATGQTRFGTSTTRRPPGAAYPLYGDTTIADATGLTQGITSQQLRNRLLAAGRVNGHASQLITDIRVELATWTTTLAAHGLYKPTDTYDTAGHAQWLAHHTHTLAAHTDAGKLHRRITHLTRQAKNCIDRPPAPRFCGQCDTKIDRHICGLALYAPRDAIEVTCPNPECRTTHNIEKLYNRTLNSADNKTFPRQVIIGNQRTDSPERYTTGIMGELGEFVHWQAFDRWLREKRIRPARYLRPNGRRGIIRHSDDDIAEYRLADIREVKRKMDRKTGKVKTG